MVNGNTAAAAGGRQGVLMNGDGNHVLAPARSAAAAAAVALPNGGSGSIAYNVWPSIADAGDAGKVKTSVT